MITRNLYHYQAEVIRVIDGDTFDAMVDLGMSTFTKVRIRILGIDAPEKTGLTKDAGIASMFFLNSFIETKELKRITIKTVKKDSFGRWLAQVWTPDGEDIAPIILAANQAVPSRE